MDYWIAIDKQKIGPMSLAEVRARRLKPDTLVWHNGLSTWCKAGSLPELAGSLATTESLSTYGSENVTIHDLPEAEQPIPAIPAYVMQPESDGYVATGKAARTTPPPMPRSYLGWSIAAIILCCTIPAIVSLIYSTRISPRYNSGDYEGAQKASDRSEIWFIVSIVFGIVQLPFSIVLNMLQ